MDLIFALAHLDQNFNSTKKLMTKFKKKKVNSKLYHIKNSKTKGQTVLILMRWLIMSHLIKV